MSTEHTAAPGRKTARTMPRVDLIAEPITISEFKKNRNGDLVRLILKSYEGTPIVDLRTWFFDEGIRKPGKGFTSHIKHLPNLAAAMNEALAKATELGLIAAESKR